MIDNHHALFSRSMHTYRDEARILRNMHVYRMDRDDHNELHRVCPEVPVLGYHALRNVLDNFHSTSKPETNFDNLLIGIEKASKHYRAHPIERELGLLAIEALELQKPFIFTPQPIRY